MRADGFETQLFGYSRSSVDRRIRGMQQEVEELTRQVADLRAKLSKAESSKEELSIALAAMRRQHIQVATQSGVSEPVTVMVGPTDSLGVITGIIDFLEGSPHLQVQFRVFRDGFYRVEGQAHDRGKLIGWLRSQSDVRDLSVDQEMIHIVPRGIPA